MSAIRTPVLIVGGGPVGLTLGIDLAHRGQRALIVEERVDPRKINGLNEYDLSIAEARANAFFANGMKLANMFANESRIRNVVAAFL